jgi:dTDP-4-dehydrorhamnose reductase
MRIAVIGAGGQLGTDLVKVFGEYDCLPLTHQDIEVADRERCYEVLKKLAPEVVINTAAFHQVDACEDDPGRAFMVNAVGAKNVAEACLEINATCVFISTDFVFDGRKGAPYTESDAPSPVSTYGISKLAGEFYTRRAPKHYVMRVASLFGAAGASGKGGNFVEAMVKKGRAGEKISVVDDLWMSPTYTGDAAGLIKKITEAKMPSGIYHVTNSGQCCWLDFAGEIFNQLNLKPDLSPIKSVQLKQKALRPAFSALQSEKLNGLFGVRHWKDALTGYLVEKGYL